MIRVQMRGILFLIVFVITKASIDFSLEDDEEFRNVPNCGLTSSYFSPTTGGSHPFIGEDPWIAILMFRNAITKKPDYICSGTLINSRYVITAAHCLQDSFLEKKTLYHVRLGEHNISSPTEEAFGQSFEHYDFEIEDFSVHPYFNDDSFYSNDIALVRLGQDINFDFYMGQIYPICLPPRNYKSASRIFSARTKFRVVGWNFGAGSPSDTLRVSSVQIADEDVCSEVYRGRLKDIKLCVTTEDGACVGDSGAPLVTYEHLASQRILLGILSITVPRICQLYPSIYTSVEHYLDWIITVTEQSG